MGLGSKSRERGSGRGSRVGVESTGAPKTPGKTTLTGALQRMPSGAASDRGSPVDHWRTATAGQSSEIPYRADMERLFGRPFGNVQSYRGGDSAVSGLTGFGAAAATHGNQVAFQDVNPSRRLVAHELAHVVQQDGAAAGVQAKAIGQIGGSAEARADAAADAVVAGLPAGDVGAADTDLIHLAPINTNGGSWDTTTYTPNSAPTGAVGEGLGCHIKLEFTANDLVESTKIGLIQSVKAMKSSAPAGPRSTVATGVGDPEENQLIMTAGQADPGREIDRAVHPGGRALPNTSPVYGVHNSPGNIATSLTDGRPTTGTSQWGSHVKDPTTHLFKPAAPARVDDRPGRAIEFAGQTYEHTFEVAAIALEGPIPPNTYLGSVSWGWRNDASGAVTVDPIAVVQAGTASSAWMGAASRWNAATFTETGTANTHASVDIPTTAAASAGSVAAPDMTTAAIIARIPVVDAELKTMAGLDAQQKQFEKTALEAELQKRKAKVSVLVRSTEDWLGADEVYVVLSSATGTVKSAVIDINDGQRQDFLLSLAPLLPMAGPVTVKVYDEDGPLDSDDLIVEFTWSPPFAAARNSSSMDGADYGVTIQFER